MGKSVIKVLKSREEFQVYIDEILDAIEERIYPSQIEMIRPYEEYYVPCYEGYMMRDRHFHFTGVENNFYLANYLYDNMDRDIQMRIWTTDEVLIIDVVSPKVCIKVKVEQDA